MMRELLTAALQSKWAIRREALPGILAQIRTELNGAELPKAGPYDRYASDGPSGPVAVIRIVGSISHRACWWGGASCERIKLQFRAALADDTITAIVFDVDSPGGTVDGVPELAAEIFKARGRKPVIFVANGMMCSAALWLGAQGDELVVSPSSETGSVGVWTIHQDVSKMLEDWGIKISLIFAGEHKVDGNPFEPLDDDARADMQAMCDQIYADFLAAVAKGRGTSAGAVKKAYGTGRTYMAKEAVSLGLADRVATLDDVVTKLLGRKATAVGMRAELGHELQRNHTSVVSPEDQPGPEPDPEPAQAAAAQAGCGCDPACRCASEGSCPEDCTTCQDDCDCAEAGAAGRAAAAEQAAIAAARIAADTDGAAAAVAIAEQL